MHIDKIQIRLDDSDFENYPEPKKQGCLTCFPILMADDEPFNIAVIEGLLEKKSIKLDKCHNG